MMVLFYIRKIHQIHGGFCYPQEFHGRRFPPPSWGSFLYFLGFFCLEEENAITYVVGFMEIGVVIALFPLFFGKKEAERKQDWLWWRCFPAWVGGEVVGKRIAHRLRAVLEVHTDYGRSPLLSLSVFIPKRWKDGVASVSCGYRFLCDMAFSVLFLVLFPLFYARLRGFFLSVRMWRQQGLTHRFG